MIEKKRKEIYNLDLDLSYADGCGWMDGWEGANRSVLRLMFINWDLTYEPRTREGKGRERKRES